MTQPRTLASITNEEWIRYRWTEVPVPGPERWFLQTGERTPDEAAAALRDIEALKAAGLRST